MRYSVNKDCVLPTENGTLFLSAGSIFNTANNKLTSCGKNMLPLLLDHDFLEEKGTLWKPNNGEVFFFIHSETMVGSKEYSPWDPICREQVSSGNCFQYKWQAEGEVAKRRAKTILLEDSKGYMPDPQDSDVCYQVLIRTGTSQLDVGQIRTDCVYADGIFFNSYTNASKSMEEHRKEWLTLFNLYGETENEEV